MAELVTTAPPARWVDRVSTRTCLAGAALLLACEAVSLHVMGQVWTCRCGHVRLWAGVVKSAENSQQLTDWYTFSHVIHGFGFYGLLWLVLRRLPIRIRFLLATIVEVSWELFENTPFVIDRYRAATISLHYYGDSVLNSSGDILAMMLGFWLASRLPWRVTILLTIVLELFVGYWIRDNLTLNLIMLLYPVEAIRRWQMG
ncbi:MAG TPA: DUF2585 domain-containing protein [Vicinamibacterales bacterium]|nr:DUF2585 domain-containing protein [Vicinamibacterales bacterium]